MQQLPEVFLMACNGWCQKCHKDPTAQCLLDFNSDIAGNNGKAAEKDDKGGLAYPRRGRGKLTDKPNQEGNQSNERDNIHGGEVS